MTAITFGLSALFPGQTAGLPEDADWIEPVPLMSWDDTTDTNFMTGLMEASGHSIGNILSDTLDVPSIQHGSEYYDTVGLTYSKIDVATVSIASGAAGISLDLGSWDSVKDIEISKLSSYRVQVSNFVDTWINAPDDDADHQVILTNAKRGMVALGDGSDSVQVDVLANEYTWPSHFVITSGNGNDIVSVQPQLKYYYQTGSGFTAPAGWDAWNQSPQLTTADITVGNGNDRVILTEVSGTVHVGNGSDEVDLADGSDTVWLGAGAYDSVTIGRSPSLSNQYMMMDTVAGNDVIHIGSGHDDVYVEVDANPALTPRVTLDFIHGETGGSTLATADRVDMTRWDAITQDYLNTDFSTVTINLLDYSPGSKATLIAATANGPMLLQIKDAATGSVDALALTGTGLTSIAALNLHFITSGV